MVESPTRYQREKLWGPFSLRSVSVRGSVIISYYHLSFSCNHDAENGSLQNGFNNAKFSKYYYGDGDK